MQGCVILHFVYGLYVYDYMCLSVGVCVHVCLLFVLFVGRVYVLVPVSERGSSASPSSILGIVMGLGTSFC